MKEKDLNEIANLEKAISKRWGHESVVNPRSYWTDEKENLYNQQLKKLSEKEDIFQASSEKVEVNGIFVPKKLVNREKAKRNCSVCGVFSFDLKDDLYFTVHDCCYKCYVQWVEDREERWKSGWRPNLEKK